MSSLVDHSWELVDPNPNVHELFMTFNREYFYNQLGPCSVSWSKRMTLCAGVCSYSRHGGCSIRLSQPLLSFRPRKDLVETLLHEMIHAYLFIINGTAERQEHGPNFVANMERINKMAGTNITVYHSFHDEVTHYKTHVWKCNGRCTLRAPYFGIVRRSMNRAPGPNDFWFKDHQSSCGGKFVKISEPEPKSKPAEKKPENKPETSERKKTAKAKKEVKGQVPITQYYPTTSNGPNKVEPGGSQAKAQATSTSATNATVNEESRENKRKGFFGPDEPSTISRPIVPFSGKGHVLGHSDRPTKVPRSDHPLLLAWKK